MPTTCSQCEQDIGGHDPKCVIKGQWHCERCVYLIEMEDQIKDACEKLAVEMFENVKARQDLL